MYFVSYWLHSMTWIIVSSFNLKDMDSINLLSWETFLFFWQWAWFSTCLFLFKWPYGLLAILIYIFIYTSICIHTYMYAVGASFEDRARYSSMVESAPNWDAIFIFCYYFTLLLIWLILGAVMKAWLVASIIWVPKPYCLSVCYLLFLWTCIYVFWYWIDVRDTITSGLQASYF